MRISYKAITNHFTDMHTVCIHQSLSDLTTQYTTLNHNDEFAVGRNEQKLQVLWNSIYFETLLHKSCSVCTSYRHKQKGS